MIRKLLAAIIIVAVAAAVAVTGSPAFADSFRNDQWYLKALNIARIQAISRGSGIIVAIVDSGTYPHPDLRRNLLRGKSFAAGGGNDGRTDTSGHGTNMAALIASHGRGADDGVLGIAPAAKILPVKISTSGQDASVEMGRGIEWAIEQKAGVINISANIGPAFEVQDAVAAALEANVVVVASAGNTSQDAILGYPAAIEGVLAVGATGRNGRRASFSVKDPKVAICAPGVDVTTAEPPNRYVDVSGTSPAAAIVSGAAALVRAEFPELSAEEVIHRLSATADDIGPPGRDDECGYGRLNIVKALTADVPPLEGATTSTPPPTTKKPPATTSPAAALPPAQGDRNGSSAAIVFGALGGVALAVGVLAFVSLRRRRNFQ